MQLKRCQTAIITGGGSGFGAGIARVFAAQRGRASLRRHINSSKAQGDAAEVGAFTRKTNVANARAVAALS